MSRDQWWNGYYEGLKKGITIARKEYERRLNRGDYDDDTYGEAEDVIRDEYDPSEEELDEFFEDGDVKWDNDDCIDSKKKYRKLLKDWNSYWDDDDEVEYADPDDEDEDDDDEEEDEAWE